MRRRPPLLVVIAVCALAILETLGQDRQGQQRVRRGLSCSNKSEYQPRGKDYCCNKCTRGHYKRADCSGPRMRTFCEECKEGTYLKLENYEKKCRSCRVCDAAFHQITVKECTRESDTVCSCPPGMFQIRIESTNFYCKNCTVCKTGTRIQCSGFNNTVCHCQHEYYHNQERNECLSCDSCNPGNDCQKYCQVHQDGRGSALLIVAIVSSSVSLITIVAGLYVTQRKLKRHAGPQYQTETDINSPSELVIGKSERFLAPVQAVSRAALIANSLPRSSDLPDCVKTAGQSQLPNNSQVNYEIADMVPASRWKEFLRRLGMSDRDIERSELDHRHSFREAQYEMVKLWRQKQGGRGATTEAICKVLQEMGLNDCAEHLQEALQ
ncbi:tumor necrosis factor receptor superfamily member 1A-like [Heptranchias perlo]|uniref:tumor necrosis factor receptor superfamily member 1A-like n=1 Tax=Heptranchias perlo TaxID=212740 RepID=UPI00355A55BA